MKGLNWVLISEIHPKLFRTFSVWINTLLTTLKHFLRYWSTSKDPKMAYLKTCSLSFVILIAFLVETDAGEWMWNKLLSRLFKTPFCWMCYWSTSMLLFGHAVKRVEQLLWYNTLIAWSSTFTLKMKIVFRAQGHKFSMMKDESRYPSS